jgi:clan AA aspartic protease
MKLEGAFDAHLTPRLRLTTAQRLILDVVVDTGFNGELVLPRKLIRRLKWPLKGQGRVELADGSLVHTDVYEGRILWFGQECVVTVYATASEDGLLGTQMLMRCTLFLDPDENKVILTRKP